MNFMWVIFNRGNCNLSNFSCCYTIICNTKLRSFSCCLSTLVKLWKKMSNQLDPSIIKKNILIPQLLPFPLKSWDTQRKPELFEIRNMKLYFLRYLISQVIQCIRFSSFNTVSIHERYKGEVRVSYKLAGSYRRDRNWLNSSSARNE